MKKWVTRFRVAWCALAIIPLFAAAHVAFAQEPGGPPPFGVQGEQNINVDKQLSNLTKHYSLSNEQKEQIRPILVDVKQKMAAVSQDQSLAFEDRFSKLRQIRDDEVARISALMTDTQRVKYQKDQQKKQREDEGGLGGPPPGGPPPDGGPGGPPPGI